VASAKPATLLLSDFYQGRAGIPVDVHPVPATTAEANDLLREARNGVCVAMGAMSPDGWLEMLRNEVQWRRSLNVQFSGPSLDCWTHPQYRGEPGCLRRPTVVPFLCGACVYAEQRVLDVIGALDEQLDLCQALVEWQIAAREKYSARSLWVPGVWCDRQRCTETERDVKHSRLKALLGLAGR
jgi:hypothetical protein